MSTPRPGYVYVLGHPRWPDWFKVGHTHRPPYRRAQELSRTAIPEAFAVNHARFVWDAVAAERWVHQRLVSRWGPQARRKEFFQVDLPSIRSCVDSAAPLLRPSAQILDLSEEPWRHHEEDWGATREGLEERWAWAEERWRSPHAEDRHRGWAEMEALSSSGWGEGSWRLADWMMRHSPTDDMARRAVWVLDAAKAQGVDAAGPRAAWLRSFLSPEGLEAWHQVRHDMQSRYQGLPLAEWPQRDRETWEADLKARPCAPSESLPRPSC